MPGGPAWVHPEAIQEARAARGWYGVRSAEVAEAFMAELDLAIERIEEAPRQWPPYLGETRRYILRRFPGRFPFAAAGQIPRLMAELERGPLRQFTPCRFSSLDQTARALAVVHTELMLIHPFRDGNGRVGRMLAILMALQAKLPPLNFGTIRSSKRQEYFVAVRAGLERNYEPMERIFSAVIRRTLEIAQARRL